MTTLNYQFQLFTTNDILALQQGKFELECFEMRLENYDNQNTTMYSGPGVIRQLPNKRLTFTLFATQPYDYDLLMRRMSIPIGQLISKDNLFRLRVRDRYGREWVSDDVFPNYVQDQSTRGTLCEGRLNDLSCSARRVIPGNSFMTCYVFSEIDIPIDEKTKRQHTIHTNEGTIITHSGQTSHSFAGLSLHLVKDHNILKIHVEANTLPEDIHVTIQQALGFVLAHPLNWSVVLKRGSSETVSLRYAQNDIGQTRVPIKFDSPSNTRSFWRMFELYFQYMSSAETQGQYHIISQGLRAIYRVSKQTLAAQALALTAVLESAVNLVYASHGEVSDEEREQIDQLSKSLLQIEGISPRLRNRVQGSLNSMKQTRVGDRLQALILEGAVTKVQYKAWQELRNGSSHSLLESSKEAQESLKQYNTVLVLFYHLVFYAIKYTGPYTDYSTAGQPTKIYNPTITK